MIVVGPFLFMGARAFGGDADAASDVVEDQTTLECPTRWTKVITIDYGETDASSWNTAEDAVLNSSAVDGDFPMPVEARHLIAEPEPGMDGLVEIGETLSGGTAYVLYLDGRAAAHLAVGELAGGGYEIIGAGAC